MPDAPWLSNLEGDRAETKNLANEEQPDRVKEMTEKIRAREREVGLPSVK